MSGTGNRTRALSQEPHRRWPGIARSLLLMRLLTLVLIGAFASVGGHLGVLSYKAFQPWWLCVVGLALAFSWAEHLQGGRYMRLATMLEASAVIGVVAAAGAEGWPLLIYLVMTPAFAGLALGGWTPVLVVCAQAAMLVAVTWTNSEAWLELPAQVLLRLVFVGLLFGAATSLINYLLQGNLRRGSQYEEALALLQQLRDLTRELPSGLGIDTVAAETRRTLADQLGAEEVALFAAVPSGFRLYAGPAEASVLADPDTLAPAVGTKLQAPPPRAVDPANPWTDHTAVRLLALRVNSTTQAVAAARYRGRPPAISREKARRCSSDAAAKLAAAEVYADVREQATAEERRRLSREIHDGVAQDLTALAYQLDNIAAESGLEPVSEAAEEVRRLVRELRLSIFALRTSLEAGQGLGQAIGEYAQQVAASTEITVHTSIRDQGAPLEPHAQHELMRVCQEAIANARRHAGAQNLWVTYRNDSDRCLLSVADDGAGFPQKGDAPGAGAGLSIMRERAARIGGEIAIRERSDGGTVVEVRLQRGPESELSRSSGTMAEEIVRASGGSGRNRR